jgi:hypothetical protein
VNRFALALLLALAACKGETPPDAAQTNVGPVPPQLCAQVKKQLQGLSNQLAVQYNDKGEATVTQEAWMAMTPDNHADFAKTIAFVASCASGHQAEAQPVRIHNESGTMLLESTVSTKVDLRSVMN